MGLKCVLQTFVINVILFIVNFLENMVKKLDKYDVQDEPEIIDESNVVFSFGEFLNKNIEIRVGNELTLANASDENITSMSTTYFHEVRSEIADHKLETPVELSPTDLDCPSEEPKFVETLNNLTYESPASALVKDSCLEIKPVTDLVTVNRFQSKFFVARSLGIRKRFQKMIQDLSDCENAQGDTLPPCMYDKGILW